MTDGAPSPERLRALMQRVVRGFGGLADDRTPCGMPMSPTQAHALMALRAQGAMSQRRLGSILRVDKSNVARLCAKLEEAGSVTQQVDPADRRGRVVALTARGAKQAAAVEASSRARFEALWRAIGDDQQAATLAGLEALVAAIDSLAEAGDEGDEP